MSAQPQFLHEPRGDYGLWTKKGYFPPRKYFKTEFEASAAAEKMAEKYPDMGKFHVIHFVEKVSVVAPA